MAINAGYRILDPSEFRIGLTFYREGDLRTFKIYSIEPAKRIAWVEDCDDNRFSWRFYDEERQKDLGLLAALIPCGDVIP